MSILICFLLKKERRRKGKEMLLLPMSCIEVVHNGGMDCGNGGHSSPFGGRMFCLCVPWVDLGRG